MKSAFLRKLIFINLTLSLSSTVFASESIYDCTQKGRLPDGYVPMELTIDAQESDNISVKYTYWGQCNAYKRAIQHSKENGYIEYFSSGGPDWGCKQRGLNIHVSNSIVADESSGTAEMGDSWDVYKYDCIKQTEE